jgi:hypothetical protein
MLVCPFGNQLFVYLNLRISHLYKGSFIHIYLTIYCFSLCSLPRPLQLSVGTILVSTSMSTLLWGWWQVLPWCSLQQVKGVQESSLELCFNFHTGTTFQRTWWICVDQIHCGEYFTPPHGCAQYFKSASGRVKSFNFGTSDDYHHLNAVCFRMDIAGYPTGQQMKESPFTWALPANFTNQVQGWRDILWGGFSSDTKGDQWRCRFTKYHLLQ